MRARRLAPAVGCALLAALAASCTPDDPGVGLRRAPGGEVEVLIARCGDERVQGVRVGRLGGPAAWEARAVDEAGVEDEVFQVVEALDGFDVTGSPAVLGGPPRRRLVITVSTTSDSVDRGTTLSIRSLPKEGFVHAEEGRVTPMDVGELHERLAQDCPDPTLGRIVTGLLIAVVVGGLIAFGLVALLVARAAVGLHRALVRRSTI